ncbi:MAG: hypothetical protein HQM10_22715 [Candidatus Riflebacteria bacterium]|nr:hypothetical protein [Candidatus Riflebacteria bacterium]
MLTKMTKIAIFSLMFAMISLTVTVQGEVKPGASAEYLKELSGNLKGHFTIGGLVWRVGNELEINPAINWIKKQGQGWRAPSRNELKALYNAHAKIQDKVTYNAVDFMQSKCVWGFISSGESRHIEGASGWGKASSVEYGRIYWFMNRMEWDTRVSQKEFGPLTGLVVAVHER